ncbi:tape measure protein [Bacteroides faecis]|uniref:tape measure protein n=1 Tax=Bacteroides faecis TaxID=674529 RepID=UPI003563A2D5
MASRLSFSIALNFLTENFKKGTNQVKAAFRSMQMQVLTFAAALGAGGLGLTNLVSRFIEVAKESSRVTTALKNVSGTMGQFAENQRFLLDMAKKYGLEINALTGNYAKFTAAASISGMTILEQRKIFESMSRAVTAFGMSAEDSNGVFLALSQMMSKGKISSEELRLQMGERLPIALQAMAKAAGTSVAGLDELMKKGKLMSADVLPKFAKALDEMIPNVDTDNLETSLNRLKNAFTELVDEADIKGKYKSLIDWVTGAVKTATENIRSVINYAVAAIVVLVTSKLTYNIISAIAKAELAAKAAARRAAKDAGQKFDEIAWKAQKTSASIKMAFSRAMLSIKVALTSIGFTAIFAVIGGIIAHMVTLKQEAERIRKVFSDYKKEAASITHTPEIIQLKVIQDLYNKAADGSKLKEKYQNRIIELLGGELKKNQDINDAVRERIKLLEATAKVDFFTQKKIAAEDKLKEIYNKRGGEEAFNFQYRNAIENQGILNFGGPAPIIGEMEEATALRNIIKDADANLRQYTEYLEKNKPSITIPTDTTATSTKKTPLQKQQESYDKQLEELGAELELGKITQAEYNKALGELNIKMYAQAKGTGDKDVLGSTYFQSLKTAAEKAIRDQDKNAALVEFEKIQKEYNNKVKELQSQESKGLITRKELNENLASLSLDAAKSAASIKGIGDEADVFIAAMNLNAKMLASPIKIKPRDTTFDYKKTKVDIASEQLEAAKEYADKLKEQAKSMGKTLEDEVANALANVPTLEKALNLAQVKEDVKDLTKELGEMKWDALKGTVSTIDGVASAFQRLKDAFDPETEASRWEKLMAIWNTMASVVDGILSVAKTIESITELTNKLAKAKEAEAAIDTATTSQKVSNAATGAAATVAATTIEKEAAKTEVAANTAKGASAVGASAAKKLPWPISLIAIGGAIAAALALFAAIPKFARGGVVTGGPSSGDKMLARVNAGEMILNQGQQSRLFEAINSGRLGGGGNISSSVTTRVRAKDLILTINNELKSQGKKPIS